MLLLNGLLLNGLISIASSSGLKETVLQHSLDVLKIEGSDDSWGAMAIALDHVRSGAASPIYRSVFFERNVKFQYPPTSLFALMGMQAVAPPERVRTTDQDVYAWPTLNDLVALFFLALAAAATAALIELRLRHDWGLSDRPLQIGLRSVLVIGLALTFYPLVKAFSLGQIQVWINGLFAAAILCWAMGRKTASGVLTGIVWPDQAALCIVRFWALLRKEWRFAFACIATGCAGLIASIVVFGWNNHVDYLPVLSYLAERGETYYPNHSVNGLLNRLMSIADPNLYRNLDWGDGSFPPFNRWVYWPTAISSAAILVAILRRNRERDPDRTPDFCTMAVSCTVASRSPGNIIMACVPSVRGPAGQLASQPRPIVVAGRAMCWRAITSSPRSYWRRRSGMSCSRIFCRPEFCWRCCTFAPARATVLAGLPARQTGAHQP
jgi:hypothetical protein